MKRTTLLSALFIAIISAGIMVACTKPPVTPPKKSPLEVLTGSAWGIDELRYLQNNTPGYYKRDGNNNTHNYSLEYLEFKKDLTGIKHESWGTAPFTWSFNNAEKTEIKIILQESQPLSIIWEHVTYENDLITYTEYYKRGATHSLATGRRIPVQASGKTIDKF